ncbi:UDP-N-acetylglucosamine--N-acetylmuramyl-(pentapeptide) pyrophosphoryl-undecaprenol N-acetylglucosamine transferase [Patescibacteria group bacterium]|nr:UDP-N-acetylglucosamine--N-acetylmuramyl-(pentapeptide) pyrophosphoryl-undecaprenol N-acetylglucosamine transferase [Patescibacteria group bacterium]MBU1890757.1 UDP-N-acetylglucosamine--N-acetylmuramyl-(pentapeptide) pyrophosphoryl-undecaprenol N-acetylglucosamine transferase [Patescibacteria group bacterium]
MKVLFSGGGTGGSVTPLIAVADEIRMEYPDAEFLFLGTKNGLEIDLVLEGQIKFHAISSGKLRRYWSWSNITDIFNIFIGFFQALVRINKFKPDVVYSAGGYVGVPVVWAAWLSGVPTLIHQQDVELSLANRLVQGIASKITVTFESSLKDFPSRKTVWVGNPIRKELLAGDRERGYKLFNLVPSLPTILVFGGGTGAQKINELMVGAIFKLTKQCQILHLFGRRKVLYKINDPNYHGYEFLVEEMKDAYAVADIVVCRAGIGSLTEIAALEKPSIVIPMPDTHQEKNGAFLKRFNAAVVLDQKSIDSDFLVNVILGFLANIDWQSVLKKNIKKIAKLDAREQLTAQLISLIKKSS